MYLRNRMLGGVSSFALFAPEGVVGAGGAAAGGTDGAGAGDSGAAAAAAGAAGAGGVAGAGAGDGSDAGAAGAGAAADAGGTGRPAAGAAADGAVGAGATGDATAAAAAAAKPLAFGEKWREEIAGEDKAALTDLAKYTDPKQVYKSLRELQAKVSKGELKAPPAPLAKDATPEQKAEYRKTHGLPETAEAYVEKLALPDGVVIGEADKPLVADFAKSMFENGATQDEMNRAVNWFYTMQDQVEQQRADADGQLRVSNEVALRGEWGADYAANVNAFGSFAAMMPEETRVAIFAARTPDGRLLGNTVEFMKLGAQIAREINPAATLVVPNAGVNAGQSIADQIKTIEGKMYLPNGTENPEYWKGESGAAMQKNLRELYDAQQKMAAKGKAA